MKRSFQIRSLVRAFVGLLFVASLLPSISAQTLVSSVDAVSMTVSDMDRAVDFYSRVLTFEKISDTEIANEQNEQLEGVFGLRVRIVRMRLGEEFIELHEYLAPKGKPIPADSRSNDRWFQHVAIIVSDMDRAYRVLRQNKVEHASSGPQRLPDWNKNAGGIWAFYFKDPDGHPLEILRFPDRQGCGKMASSIGQIVFGRRPHCNRCLGHRRQPEILSRHSGNACGR